MIDIGPPHDSLNELRGITGTIGKEIHMDVMVSEDQRVLVPEIYATGERARVKSKTIAEHRKAVNPENKHTVVGSLHTHPHSNSTLKRIGRRLFYRGTMSPSDLYVVISPHSPEHFMGVVNQEENVFAFRSQETNSRHAMDYLKPGQLSKQDRFAHFWYKRHGIELTIKDEQRWIKRKNGGRITDIDRWEVAMDIAKWHHIALYRGKPNQNIHRFYPEQM